MSPRKRRRSKAPAPVPPASGTVLFNADFGGVGPPDPGPWVLHDEKCDPPNDYSCPKNSNVFLDGAGNLVLRCKRESPNWLTGGAFSGAWVSTFSYGYGAEAGSAWPPKVVLIDFPVPFRIEMEALMPRISGAWASLWLMSTNRTPAQGVYELDVAEERMTYPHQHGAHQHLWLNKVDSRIWDGYKTVTDMGANLHLYSADVLPDKVAYAVDGAAVGEAYGVAGRFGIILSNAIAKPGSWGEGGQPPDPDDPGPWDMVVRRITVSAL